VAAVSGAARTLYLDWLSQGATRFGHLVAATPLRSAPGFPAPAPSVCYVFADGLRYDVARRMVNELGAAGLRAECNWRFGPLPGVTNTAKPAVSPLDDAVFAAGTGLAARFADGRLVTADSLRNELKKSGLAILNGLETGDPSAGPAWTECGAFDSKGHALGAGLAGQLGPEIGVLVGRIRSLLEAGWKEIRLTTDHGWVLLPGNLEKAHLPEHLTEVRKGRCARLKTGATTEFQTVPWHWDPAVSIAIAPGARCFEEGKAYEHGGLSVQECVLPLVTVRSAAAAASAGRLGEFVWKGFRLVVPVTAASAGSRIDLRTKAGDAGSSLCGGGKAVTGESVALVVEDEHRGAAAHLVLLDATGAVVDKVNASVPDD